MVFKRFALSLFIKIVFLLATVIGLTYLLTLEGYLITTIFVLIIILIQCFRIYQFVLKTNNELSRFLDAARYADYSQRFEFEPLGAGFAELGKTFTDILSQFHSEKANQEEELKYLKAIIEHAPIPIISLHSDGLLTLWNNSSRRLFGSNQVSHLDHLLTFGTNIKDDLLSIKPGDRKLVIFDIDGLEHQLSISATEIIITGKQEKLLSLQNIQSELEGAQLQAWQDLVRVLTHEIMNSITPVASLAKTAADLLEDAKEKVTDNKNVLEDLSDVSDAIQTVARRSDGLMNFVTSYRQLTRLPEPVKIQLNIEKLFNTVTTISTQNWTELGIKINSTVTPKSLELTVDKDMLEQLLINLLKNAEQALANQTNPQVKLSAYLNKRGRVMIDVEDNGTGVPDEIAKKIFVPFFTTKRDGSGVGLALTRQVMIAHGGNVKLERSSLGGAKFQLIF